MKGKGLLIVVVVLVSAGALALLALLGGGLLMAQAAGAGGAGAQDVGDVQSLIEALREAGFDVQELGPIEDPLFAGEGVAIEVQGQYVQVFGFESEAAAVEASETIEAGGTIIGLATIDWVEAPHFYLQDALLVLYAGSNEALLQGLQEALGEPFLIGWAMGLPLPDGE